MNTLSGDCIFEICNKLDQKNLVKSSLIDKQFNTISFDIMLNKNTIKKLSKIYTLSNYKLFQINYLLEKCCNEEDYDINFILDNAEFQFNKPIGTFLHKFDVIDVNVMEKNTVIGGKYCIDRFSYDVLSDSFLQVVPVKGILSIALCI